MADQGTPNEEDGREPLLSVAHDLRHSLFALKTGIQLLAQVRDDPAHFDELQELLAKEVKTFSDHLNELLRIASD